MRKLTAALAAIAVLAGCSQQSAGDNGAADQAACNAVSNAQTGSSSNESAAHALQRAGDSQLRQYGNDLLTAADADAVLAVAEARCNELQPPTT